MSNKTVLLSCLTMCVLAIGVMYWLEERQHHKVAVVDAVRLFDEFNMKKELETKEKHRLQAISVQVDSVGNAAKMMKAKGDDSEVKRLTYLYQYLKEGLEMEYKKGNEALNLEVWKRLNPIIEQYGKNAGLHLIIGANGMGTVLYQDEYYDVTNEMIRYANKKYEGGN